MEIYMIYSYKNNPLYKIDEIFYVGIIVYLIWHYSEIS